MCTPVLYRELVVIVVVRVIETASDGSRSRNDKSALTEGVAWLQDAVDSVRAVDSEHQRPTAGDTVGRPVGSARLVRVRELVWSRAVVLGLGLARLQNRRLGLARLRDWRLGLARLRDWRLGLARLQNRGLGLPRYWVLESGRHGGSLGQKAIGRPPGR
jgi:hypothetical protein